MKKEGIKLICFDLDQTVITGSSWRWFNRALGISEEDDTALYESYYKGDITYDEWNHKLMDLYRTHPYANKEKITEILMRYTYAEGIKEAVDYLKGQGYILVLISGSIDILVTAVANELGIPYSKANNTFIFDESGRLHRIDDGGDDTKAKARYLEEFSKELAIPIQECAAIGDGANDVELFRITAHGITFRGSTIEDDAWKIIDTFADLKNIF